MGQDTQNVLVLENIAFPVDARSDADNEQYLPGCWRPAPILNRASL